MTETNNTRQDAWVAIGSLFAFAVSIISPMILSRFFSVGDYGTYKQVMYVYSTLLIVFTLGLPKTYAYFLPKHPYDESKAIINKITLLFFLLGAIFSFLLFVGADVIADFLGNPDLIMALRIFSPVPFFLLPTMGLDGIFATYQKTQYLALYTIITSIITIMFTILPVILLNGNYIYAIIGFGIASIMNCATALLLRSLPIKNYPKKNTELKYKEIIIFAIPLMLASIWGMLYTSANQFFVSRYYGKEAFAIFSNGFTELPFIGMVVGSISTVLLPVFSRLEKGDGLSGDMIQIWNSAMLKSAKILFPISIFCIFMARLVMICLYGLNYDASTIYFQIKSLYGLFYVVPFAPLLIAMGKTKVYSNMTIYFTIILVVIEYFCVKHFDSPVSIAIASEICSIVKCIVFFAIIAHFSLKKTTDILPWKQLLHVLAISVIACVPVYFMSHCLNWNKFVLLFVDCFVFCLFFYILCWVDDISYKDIFSSVVKNKKWLKLIP